MKFMLLLYGDEAAWDALGPDGQGAVMEEYAAVDQAMQRDSVKVAGEALEPSATAVNVRVRDGEAIVTDGPYVEAKEMIGGFYIVECGSRDEAVAWAARIPDATTGGIEVRPVLDLAALGYEDAESS